jgi:hypothetical protein
MECSVNTSAHAEEHVHPIAVLTLADLFEILIQPRYFLIIPRTCTRFIVPFIPLKHSGYYVYHLI